MATNNDLGSGLAGQVGQRTGERRQRAMNGDQGIARNLMPFCLALALSGLTGPSWAIDTGVLERPWPRQQVREYEIYKYAVRWRQRVSKTEGIFAGANFTAPSTRDRTWALATDYTDLGRMTPGVSSVRFLEKTPTRQIVQIDVKILWKDLTLTFEVEQDPPNALRFRLVNDFIGEYRGVSLFRLEGEQTAVELATWLKPAVKVPSRLILWAERVVLLKGIRSFLQTCERPPVVSAT